MPTIEISEAQFERLQAFATPLVDSVETAFSKILDLAESVSKASSRLPSAWRPKLETVPDLSHATLKGASINGWHLPSGICNWNALLSEVVKKASGQLPPNATLSDLILVNHVAGRKIENGYKFLPQQNISIQGQNANNAWKAVSHLAKSTGLKVDVQFYWANHPKAEKPGEMGRLSI